jgi:hypothetical protein
MKTVRETWLFRDQLPAGSPPRYMASVLKWLWRRWGVKATAVLDAPPDPPRGSHQPASTASGKGVTAGHSPADPEAL